MLFQTEVIIESLTPAILYADSLLFLGSCFADEVGSICKGLGFNALVNPFGVLYNPASIAQSLKRLQDGNPFTHDEVIRVGEEFYCTFSHNTDFWKPSEQELLETVNLRLAEARMHFQAAKWIVISLGTSWVFREKTTGQVVSNCHKLPANRFERTRLTVAQSEKMLADMVRTVLDKQIIFTVSPLRHLKDGLHENQLSKASLLLAVDQICHDFSNAHYFPAYEILLDELRDYRFYKEDMVHPTDQAVNYIFEQFVQFAVNPSEQPAMAAAMELKQMLHHKPLFPESKAYKRFEILKEQKINEVHRLYPSVNMNYLCAP